MNVAFTALVPTNLRLACAWANEHDPAEPPCTLCVLAWDRLDEVGREDAHLDACIWDFARITDGGVEAALRFILRWGAPNFGHDEDGTRLYRPSFVNLSDVMDDARSIDLALRALIATEGGELLDIDQLYHLWCHEAARLFPSDEESAERAAIVALLPMGQRYEEEDRIWRRRRENERRSGQQLDYQRWLVVETVSRWAGRFEFWSPSWKGGRRSGTPSVVGTDGLVGRQLREIFAAPVLGVFLCSSCGRPFQWDEGESVRRPRRDRGRYCGQSCRDQSRRESNRASWQRNKEKWRPAAQPLATGGEPRTAGEAARAQLSGEA